jgi:hypothetical protein
MAAIHKVVFIEVANEYWQNGLKRHAIEGLWSISQRQDRQAHRAELQRSGQPYYYLQWQRG